MHGSEPEPANPIRLQRLEILDSSDGYEGLPVNDQGVAEPELVISEVPAGFPLAVENRLLLLDVDQTGRLIAAIVFMICIARIALDARKPDP